jgi:PAS domain S-box-containing protein
MATPATVLLLDSRTSDHREIAAIFSAVEAQGWHLIHVHHPAVIPQALQQNHFEALLFHLERPEGIEVIQQLQAESPQLPIVVLSDVDDQHLDLLALANGAQDYLLNAQVTPTALSRVIRYAIERGQILRQLQLEIAERHRSEQTLRLIVEGTASVTGTDFFQALVRSLAQALNVRYALVSGCIDSPPTRVCTYAFWQGDSFGKNEAYDLYGTPCKQVFSSKKCQYYSQNLQSLFPTEAALVELQAESYAGIPLISSSGQILGHLAVIDDKLLGNEARNTSILEIFAARAAAEIERQQVEAAFRFSQEKFTKAFRASPSAITLSTLNDGRYVEVNESCLQLFGYSQTEMLGSSALDLGIWQLPAERQVLKELLQEHDRVINLETKLRRRSGEIFPALISAEVIQLEDTPCLLAVTTDITLLKQASQALEQLAEIGELASMIVHEIRNPLTTLLMGLNSFKQLQLPPRLQTHLSLALEEGDRLQRLLRQILLYAKPQSSDLQSIEFNSLIYSLLESLQTLPIAAGKHLDYRVNTPMVQVLADRDKLKQVVINLVTNAFEATEVGQTVTVTVQAIHPNQVELQVHNGGNPIPVEIVPKLTQPFVTTKPDGTGLGLAIVNRIVTALQGKLHITSSAEMGTTITVNLPTTPEYS